MNRSTTVAGKCFDSLAPWVNINLTGIIHRTSRASSREEKIRNTLASCLLFGCSSAKLSLFFRAARKRSLFTFKWSWRCDDLCSGKIIYDPARIFLRKIQKTFLGNTRSKTCRVRWFASNKKFARGIQENSTSKCGIKCKGSKSLSRHVLSFTDIDDGKSLLLSQTSTLMAVLSLYRWLHLRVKLSFSALVSHTKRRNLCAIYRARRSASDTF